MAKVSFYFDEMMPRAAAKALEELGYNVVMAIDVDMVEQSDPEHLAYASQHKLTVVTFDRPFAGRTSKISDHSGLICLSGTQQDIGQILRTLTEFGDEHTLEDASGQVFWR